MRLDRTASVYLFQPWNRWLRPRRTGIPILMYHRVPEVDRCSKHPYYCTNTAVETFARQIRFLYENGYRTVNVTEAFRRVQTNVKAQKLVAITFDDGYGDFYRNVFPILNRYGYSATMFLPTAFIADFPKQFKGEDCLTWSQVRELRKAGMEFGSHSVNHPQLRDVGPKELQREIHDSKRQIEDKLGAPVVTFSYPYAFPEADPEFVKKLQTLLCESGYRSGVSTIIGRVRQSDNPFFLKRLPVNSHDDPRFFRAKLEGGYDWLHKVQYVSKLMSARRHTAER
jgi:peptidoglycan/xylan/chitin deacetylase (PgdA/CDA1 family)